jgi:hypothetical protein
LELNRAFWFVLEENWILLKASCSFRTLEPIEEKFKKLTVFELELDVKRR